jgi:hypothetical protein
MMPLLLSVLFACANTNSGARIHPEAVTGIPNCTECHTDSWGALNHQAVDFFLKHGVFASNARQACASCHAESFCSDCHAHKEEIKPSDKYRDAPERWLPHQGDYLNQHKIDGRINPASCVKCHGRQNNERCLTCHK